MFTLICICDDLKRIVKTIMQCVGECGLSTNDNASNRAHSKHMDVIGARIDRETGIIETRARSK